MKANLPHDSVSTATTQNLRITCNVGSKVLRAADGSGASSFPAVFIVAGRTLNGEYFPQEVLARAASKFVSAKMYVNHPRSSADQMTRDLRDLAGLIESAEFSGNELRGTIKVSETVDWLRTLIAEGIGGDLSINVMGTVEWRESEKLMYVTEITDVLSVDFVTEGAAHGRVMEAFNRSTSTPEPNPPTTSTPQSHMDLKELTLATLRAGRADLVSEITAEATTPLTEELNGLKAKVAEYEAKEQVAAHTSLVESALTDSGLDAKLYESLRKAIAPLATREEMDGVLAGIKASLAEAVPASKGNPAAEDAGKSAAQSKLTEAARDTFGVEVSED